MNEINELVSEWVEKAEGDTRTAEREALVTEKPNWDAVCFHAQQTAEKYFKALLQERGIPFPKVHDLSILGKLLFSTYPEWEVALDSLKQLSLLAVEFRYSGESALKQDAVQAVKIMR